MKKSYLKKNLMSGIKTFLAYGWESEQLSSVFCEQDSENRYSITSLSGDLVYFTYTDCEGLYNDFIIRFGSNVSRETIEDIDIFQVIKKNGKVTSYKLEFFIHIEKKCICDILGEILLGLTYVVKEHF